LPERIRRHARPSLLIRTTTVDQESLAIGQSRIGGVPDLPRGFEWPRYDGLALSFIAQFDLAELARQSSVLPDHGTLAFFYDSDQRIWGFDPKHRGSAMVAYFPDAPQSLIRTELPADVHETGRFSSCSVQYEDEVTVLDAQSEFYQPELTDDEREPIDDFRDENFDEKFTPVHRIGGHADVIQNPMELECQLVANGLYCGDATGYQDPRAAALTPGATDWRLLLQIDSDDNAGMMWGDCGRLYSWIREEDLRAKAFEKCWMILQCS
jgi:uncharacterized protein YwqG